MDLAGVHGLELHDLVLDVHVVGRRSTGLGSALGGLVVAPHDAGLLLVVGLAQARLVKHQLRRGALHEGDVGPRLGSKCRRLLDRNSIEGHDVGNAHGAMLLGGGRGLHVPVHGDVAVLAHAVLDVGVHGDVHVGVCVRVRVLGEPRLDVRDGEEGLGRGRHLTLATR